MHDASIDSKGGLFVNAGENQFDISWPTMINFLKSIHALARSDAFESSPTNVKFVVNLAKLHNAFIQKIRFGGTNLDLDISKYLIESNNTIIKLIIEMDDKDVIGLCVPELSDFINLALGMYPLKTKKIFFLWQQTSLTHCIV